MDCFGNLHFKHKSKNTGRRSWIKYYDYCDIIIIIRLYREIAGWLLVADLFRGHASKQGPFHLKEVVVINIKSYASTFRSFEMLKIELQCRERMSIIPLLLISFDFQHAYRAVAVIYRPCVFKRRTCAYKCTVRRGENPAWEFRKEIFYAFSLLLMEVRTFPVRSACCAIKLNVHIFIAFDGR